MLVILATDGSPQSLKAATLGHWLGIAHSDARFVVLHVVSPDLSMGDVVAGAVGSSHVLLKRQEEEARDIVARTVQALDLPQDRYTVRVESGPAGDTICRVARESAADLVLMGNRGLSMIKELLVGSVSHRVTHLAHCPVLVAR